MKKIRIISLLITILMLSTLFCACSEDNSSDKSQNNDNSQNATVAPTTPEVTYTDYITSKEDMDEVIAALIPDATYSITDISSGTSYTISNELWSDYNINYNVKLEDGTEFTMPASVKDIESKGWSFNKSEETVSSTGCMSSVDFTNTKGNKIGLTLYNGTDKEAKAKDCDVTGIEVKVYGMVFSPEFHLEKFDDTTSFTICDNITDKSTIEDVINNLGAPYKISFSTYNDDGEYSHSQVKLTYVQKSDTKQQLIFTFSGNENRILNLNFYQHI